MSNIELQRRIALLETTVREILRLKRAAETEAGAINFDDIFDNGRSKKEWQRILMRAKSLV